MKINANTTQKLAKEEMKKKDIQETRAAQTTNKKLEKNKNIDTSEIKNNPLSQNIKNTNSNIGRLQIAQKTLNSIESDAKKIAKLAQESKETLDKGEQEDLKEEMSALKKNVESAIKKATFEEINVTDGTKASAAMVKDYKVTVVPTLIFVSKDGQIIHREEGFLTESEIRTHLDHIK